MQIGVTCVSTALSQTDLAYIVEAWSAQQKEFAAAWGISPWIPVILYQNIPEEQVGTGEIRVMTIQDVLDVPQAEGYHTDEVGVVFARILSDNGADSGSHECCEETLDPTCDVWKPMGDGKEIAFECADPVEGDSYPQSVTIGGETREIQVSNYVLPSYFDPNGKAPFDRMGKLTAPFTCTPGGYQVIQDASGNVSDVFAKTRRIVFGSAAAHSAVAMKLSRPESRLLRRLRSAR